MRIIAYWANFFCVTACEYNGMQIFMRTKKAAVEMQYTVLSWLYSRLYSSIYIYWAQWIGSWIKLIFLSMTLTLNYNNNYIIIHNYTRTHTCVQPSSLLAATYPNKDIEVCAFWWFMVTWKLDKCICGSPPVPTKRLLYLTLVIIILLLIFFSSGVASKPIYNQGCIKRYSYVFQGRRQEFEEGGLSWKGTGYEAPGFFSATGNHTS